MTYYWFRVKGTYDTGKVVFEGHVKDEPGYPHSAFDKAVKACEGMAPGLRIDLSKPGQVSLRQLKGKPR